MGASMAIFQLEIHQNKLFWRHTNNIATGGIVTFVFVFESRYFVPKMLLIDQSFGVLSMSNMGAGDDGQTSSARLA
jgi:hypothetical protein